MTTGHDAMGRPKQVCDLVTRDFTSSLRAEVERESELEFGFGRQPDPTRVDLSLAEYAAANGRERH